MMLILLILFGFVAGHDPQSQKQYQATISYLIELSTTNRLHELDSDKGESCVSLECCICKKQFKNPKGSGIHFYIHHKDQLKKGEQIAILFDQDVPSQQRFEYCQKYLFQNGVSDTKVVQQVCYIISWNMHKSQTWLEVVKYVLYIILGLATLVYYSDLCKPWK